MGIRGWSCLADKPLIFFYSSIYQIKLVRGQRHLMSEIYFCTCLLCSADLTALPFLRSLWNDIYERYIWHGKGINSKEASKFVLAFLFISKSSLQFVLHVVSNLLQEIVSHIFRKTLNLCVCVCLCFVLSLSLSHLLIIERPTFTSNLVIIKVRNIGHRVKHFLRQHFIDGILTNTKKSCIFKDSRVCKIAKMLFHLFVC